MQPTVLRYLCQCLQWRSFANETKLLLPAVLWPYRFTSHEINSRDGRSVKFSRLLIFNQSRLPIRSKLPKTSKNQNKQGKILINCGYGSDVDPVAAILYPFLVVLQCLVAIKWMLHSFGPEEIFFSITIQWFVVIHYSKSVIWTFKSFISSSSSFIHMVNILNPLLHVLIVMTAKRERYSLAYISNRRTLV